MSKDEGTEKIAKILKKLRSSIEILEQKQGKIEDELATKMLSRVKRLESDLLKLEKSESTTASILESLIPDIENKFGACDSCKTIRKETIRPDFMKDMAKYRELKKSGSEDAIKALKDIKRKYAEFSQTWMELGDTYGDEGDFENALACFRIADEEGDLGYSPLCLIGITLSKLKRYEDAMDQFEKAVVKYSHIEKCPTFYHFLGTIYSEIGTVDDVDRISKLIDVPDNLNEPALVRAYMYFQMNEFSKSRENLSSFDIGESVLAQLLHYAISMDANPQDAISEITKILKDVKMNHLVYDTLLHTLKGGLANRLIFWSCENLKTLFEQLEIWFKSGIAIGAISHLFNFAAMNAHNSRCEYKEYILELSQEMKELTNSETINPTIILYLAKTFKNEEALHLAQSIDDPMHWYALGVGTCESDDREKAIEYFQKTIDLDSKYTVAWKCLLESLTVLGRKKELEETIQKAKEAGFQIKIEQHKESPTE